MKVNIQFDTETENLDNLKKLVNALQELIDHREGKKVETSQTKEEPKRCSAKTSGGCRVIPYEDMSAKMSAILYGRRH